MFAASIVVTLIATSCSTNIEKVEEIDEAQLALDSIAQADSDFELIDEYISDNNLTDDYFESATGVRYYVWQPETMVKEVKNHDIVSFTSTSRLITGKLISTTVLSDALVGDSILWTEEGLDFSSEQIYWDGDTLTTSDYTLRELLEIRANSNYPLSYSFSDDFNLEPLTFGYVSSGSTIDFDFSVGFRAVMQQSFDDLPIQLGTRIKIIVPAASTYREAVDQYSQPIKIYLSLTEPVVYDLTISNIRP